MLKKMITGGLALLSVFGAGTLASAEQMTLKLAHQWPQNEGDYVIAAAIKFAQEVEQRTDGDIRIRFYPAESLVKAKDNTSP